jgi:hypothetical protein
MALSRQAGGDLGSLKAGDRSCIEKARAWMASNPGPYQTEAFAIGQMNLPYGHRLTDRRTGEQLLFQWLGGECTTVGIYNAFPSR